MGEKRMGWPNSRDTALPYVDNRRAIAITIAVNLLMAFVFQYGRVIDRTAFLLDAAICAVTTSLIDVLWTHIAIGRIRARGALPQETPVSPLMQRLPQNPALLILVFSALFALLMTAFSMATVWFFEIQSYPFYRFVVWKLVYSAVLSAKIYELAILRFVQPDCGRPSDPVQSGVQPVKNPLPRLETLKNFLNTVIDDFGFNLLVGLFFGGTIIVGHDVIILATTRSGILLGGLILGAIVDVRMVLPIAASIRRMKNTGALPPLSQASRRISWLPERPALFALVLLPPVMLLSAAVLWSVLSFFGFETLNFFQYFVVRTLYVSLLTKPVTHLAVLRYRQPISCNVG